MDVRLVFPLLIIVVVVVTFVVVDKIAKVRMERQLRKVFGWRSLPTEQRLLAHTEFTEDYIRQDANRFRNTVTFCVSVAAAGLLMVVWLADLHQETRDRADENCRHFRTLVNIQAADLDNDIRSATTERDELVAAIDSEPVELEDLPGYDELPPAGRVFLQALLDSQVAEANAVIDRLDSDIVLLRNREDVISGFTAILDCP